MIRIRPYQSGDWPAMWDFIAPVLHAGDSYAVPREIGESDAYRMWVELPRAVRVAEDARGRVLGTYFLKPNQPGPGDHVCNCGYLVAEQARGQGIANKLCEDSLRVARELGFTAMQFNMVVSTNEVAIRQWQKHGFEIVGTLPCAFRHPQLGLVDAHVMYRLL